MPDLSKNLSSSSGDPWSPSPNLNNGGGGLNLNQPTQNNGFKPNIDGNMLLNSMNPGLNNVGMNGQYNQQQMMQF